MRISGPALDFYSCQGKVNECDAPEGPLSGAPPHTVILSSLDVTTVAHYEPRETLCVSLCMHPRCFQISHGDW